MSSAKQRLKEEEARLTALRCQEERRLVVLRREIEEEEAREREQAEARARAEEEAALERAREFERLQRELNEQQAQAEVQRKELEVRKKKRAAKLLKEAQKMQNVESSRPNPEVKKKKPLVAEADADAEAETERPLEMEKAGETEPNAYLERARLEALVGLVSRDEVMARAKEDVLTLADLGRLVHALQQKNILAPIGEPTMPRFGSGSRSKWMEKEQEKMGAPRKQSCDRCVNHGIKCLEKISAVAQSCWNCSAKKVKCTTAPCSINTAESDASSPVQPSPTLPVPTQMQTQPETASTLPLPTSPASDNVLQNLTIAVIDLQQQIKELQQETKWLQGQVLESQGLLNIPNPVDTGSVLPPNITEQRTRRTLTRKLHEDDTESRKRARFEVGAALWPVGEGVVSGAGDKDSGGRIARGDTGDEPGTKPGSGGKWSGEPGAR